MHTSKIKAEESWLTNPEVFRVNRLPAHSDHKYYESMEQLAAGEESLLQSLNGSWKFLWSPKPSVRPTGFFSKGFDLLAFGSIEVPGHMELQGHGQIQYINTMYPWEGQSAIRPPMTDPEDNPVGSYVKEFTLRRELLGKRVCISFQGVETAFYVWLNGSFVGYAEDSFTPSDFDLTPFLKSGTNRLCVEVYKRSSASWLEDQDFFRFSGIFRNVYLYAKPVYHIEDMWVSGGLLDDYETGILELSLKLSKEKCAESIQVASLEKEGLCIHVTLQSVTGELLWEENLADLTVKKHFPAIKPWSHENPALYSLTLLLYSKKGSLLEVVPYQVGFRRFEMIDRIMCLNGRRLLLNGVNRHEWNPHRGRAVTEEDMKQDIAILLKNNMNAVRTSHYPNQSLWYALCDEAGIYVMDEANLESHGSWQKMGKCDPSWNVPGSLPEWKACVLDRAESMLERDKNHACILFWSCGNESYAGEDILAMSSYFHEKDPSRLVHYEGVFWNRAFDAISDVESRMYASPKEVRAYLEQDPKKPFLLCEYMHDMGNSLGGMESYIRLSEEFPMYQGGFIWDYIDQALYRKDADGTQVLAYGGDFEDRASDYAFSGNGIVFADRTEKPAMQEVRFWYAKRAEREHLLCEKQHLTQNAIEIGKDSGTIAVNTAFEVIHGDVMLGVRGEGFRILFSYQDYGPVSLIYDDVEWLYRAPTPAFYRAATENDKGSGFAGASAVWMAADAYRVPNGYRVEEAVPGEVTITYSFLTVTVPQTEVTVSYTVYGCGTIKVGMHYSGKQGLPQLPLFGLRFQTPLPAERVTWLGLSGETYPDRKKGASFGIQESDIAVANYQVPQECGCHMDTHWMKLYREGGTLCAGMCKEPFAFSALPCTPHELEAAFHKEELPAHRRTTVSILAKMRGVGGIDSWGADVEEVYHISAEEDIDFAFLIHK